METSRRRRIDTPWGPWEPLDPSEAAVALRGASRPWWVAGGFALEAFVDRRWRDHDDLDIACLRDDALAVRRALAPWEAHVADPPGTLRPWPFDEPLPSRAHDAWVREGPGTPWRLQMMVDERAGEDWVFRRDARVRRPLATITWARDGIAFLAPEIQLLYKANQRRPKDEDDFYRIVPLLDGAQRRWLARALAIVDPSHPWNLALSRHGGSPGGL